MGKFAYLSSRQGTVLNDVSIAITANLDCALRHLRFTMVPRILWVDAISINQASTQERNHQVQIMGNIYSTAKEVIIWLGPVDKTDLYLRAVLGAMQFYFSDENQSTVTFFDYILSVIALMSEQISSPEDPEASLIAALHRIVSRPWFTRIWVVQELALSKIANVHMGDYNFPWKPFSAFMSWLPHHKLDPTRHGAVTEAVARVTRAQTDIHFASQLCRTVHLSASNPRDKVFSILGISGFSGDRIVPDYAKSIERVFSEAVAAMLRDEKLAIYYYAPLQPTRRDYVAGRSNELPSWVPDLRISGAAYLKNAASRRYDKSNQDEAYHRPDNIICWKSLFHSHPIEELFGSMCAQLPFSPVIISADLTKLHVPGVVLGTIRATSGRSFYDLKVPRSDQDHRNIVRDVYRSLVDSHNTDALDFAEAVSQGALYFYREHEKKAAIISLESELSRKSKSPNVQKRVDEFWSSVSTQTYQRTLFVATDGCIGLSYHPDHVNDIRPGDIVVGLFAINFPFILRAVGDGTFRMINVAGPLNHRWGHKFLKNEEFQSFFEESNIRQRTHGWRSGRRKFEPGASWEDYKEHGMVEFTIV
ncbi:heterokaryon incompatibility protein-domain-containing protein [Paraphoma chrysanthemicola]|uniref:Heterokaryon incompatibility protein-domain-containing protein n=1 Tax=Paraphoma chrysanthemicola TaxID=798071 RepID=A0A8K0R3U5_9PLEO|nr:heterokaryon incompatibility protein-domain-containing protein [Paraphoma chrysanthemicola]